MVELKNIDFIYPDGTVGLRNVTFSISKGQLVLLCGKNGSGKSTLLRVLAGLYRPSRGTIVINGKIVHKELKDLRSVVGIVFQNPDHQLLGETVEEDLALGPMYLGLTAKEIEARVAEAARMCNIEDLLDRNCHFLSGGEKKRVAIASVIAMKPEFILMDEPFAGLDFPATLSILEQILEMKEKGFTILISSHEVEKLAPYSDTIVVMSNGELVLSGNQPDEIFPVLTQYGVSPPCYYLLGGKPIRWLSI